MFRFVFKLVVLINFISPGVRKLFDNLIMN